MDLPINNIGYLSIFNWKRIKYLLMGSALLFLLMVATIFSMVAMLLQGTGGISGNWLAGSPTPYANTDIPAKYIDIFMQAQSKYQIPWNILAAIAKIESHFGENMSTSSAGAIGFMQFEPGTWNQYEQDGDGDGKYDPYDPWDAVFTAANYLRACNFTSDPAHAIYQYNHAWWYVTEVTELAQQYATTAKPASNGMWPLPAEYRTITSPFGMRYHPVYHKWINHDGIDISAPEGTQVFVAQPGTVLFCGWDGDYGNLIIVSHSDGSSTYYAHLSSILVTNNQSVDRSAPIGLVGHTGDATGPHLHFEVHVGNVPVDPEQWLNAAKNTGN